MTNKPQIQYVGQFYVHGSEAQALQRQQKKAKTTLPKAHRVKVEKIYVDPVALGGILVAAFMLVVMVMGAVRLRTDWAQYTSMKNYVNDLKRENLVLTHKYRQAYDMEAVQTRASAMGLVPKESVKTISIPVTKPEPKPERTWMDDLKWFLDGLLE